MKNILNDFYFLGNAIPVARTKIFRASGKMDLFRYIYIQDKCRNVNLIIWIWSSSGVEYFIGRWKSHRSLVHTPIWVNPTKPQNKSCTPGKENFYHEQFKDTLQELINFFVSCHQLSAYIMCSTAEEVREQASWNGKE